MATNGNAKHKNLAGAFGGGAAPERGAKLQGLLGSPAGAAAPPQAPPAPDPVPPVAEQPVRPATETVESPQSTQAEMVPPARPEGAGQVATRVAPPRRKRAAAEGRGVPASSVYLTADTYKALTTTKSRKIKDYAQIVQDAFAGIAKEATEQQTTPDEVLAGLFEVPESDDPWLMPSSTARAKSSTPLTEARISFSAQQREWLEEKMSTVKVSTFSEFIARVLEHHLLPPKPKRSKKPVAQTED
ncbi:hypothetical protein H7J87_12120 [Mycolicibacterium wolinskyi]|uniref:Uncharacterized protein n=1 Tax=Mycolicibacterium wolinskyi TaxID=59750 RepID=A0A1X2FJ62_9MYCO|nr:MULTISPECIES: hypothetical protein [Mycolicibacterium]MCV7286078.1 hypothetical protein [Mycolicibacterium wolinskyi]MCV7296274.1 hypothetical protein [Mycolicibacterium goodii]ORX18501.1 hypothetical protein AWC31_14460 [Mycolicibacterium wolinskyi]